MALSKLENVDAFVVRDLGNGAPAFGIVRSAPKILQGGAKELARAQTYQCAIFEREVQGASAGVNAAPEARDAAFAAFTDELRPSTEDGSLMLDAGKGVPPGALDALQASDGRGDAHARTINGLANSAHLAALSAVASGHAHTPLESKSIAIENFEHNGPAIAAAAVARGSKVTAIATSAGMVTNADGFDVTALSDALAAHGAGLVGQFSDDPAQSWRILGADVDVLFAGSKMGLISHQGAPNVRASLVVPTGSIPYTTKGALVMEAAGTTVLPDFVTTAGSMFASLSPSNDDQDQLESDVIDHVTSLTAEVTSGDEMPILAACKRAEAFLATWLDQLPFGRPFAP